MPGYHKSQQRTYMRYTFTRNKLLYRVVLVALLAISIFVMIKLLPNLTKPEIMPSDDYLHFWASGKLNLERVNPYNPENIIQLTLSQLPPEQASTSELAYLNPITLNFPWSISLLMPFALFSFPSSRFAWLIFSIIIILISTLMIWRVDGGDPRQRWLAMLVAFTFAPTISVLGKGQLTPLILLGLAGFLYFLVYRRNDWLAGLFLALLTVKPQIILLLWIPILFWIIGQKRWVIIASSIGTVVLLSIISIIPNPTIFQQYFVMLSTYHFTDWANPTIGAYLRFFWLGVDKFWIQFLPSVIGGLWVIYYWFQRKNNWSWIEETPIILFVSVITSPYLWTYDLVILVPAILLAAVWIATDWKRWATLILTLLYTVINILDLFLHMKLDEFWFIWLAPALFIWFLIVRWQYRPSPSKKFVTTIE
jgi:hypothetical protein